MLKRLDLVITAAGALEGARETETGARNTGALDREIAGAVAQEAAAEAGTMRLNPNVKLEVIVVVVF